MTETDKHNEVFLELTIRKSIEEQTDEFGNYYFEVEASNENVDLQDQIVLQRALMESKDEFLRGGVISLDHQHRRKDEDGNVIIDDSMVIGEPVDVRFDEKQKKTIVKGKLYKTKEKAKDIIDLLRAGSTRVRASVGGIFPQIIKDAKTGIETITHVLWNDLALTTAPVNNTVGYANFAKSMTAAEFVRALPLEVKKSLCAGYNTDSAAKTGGETLIPEDVGTKTIDATEKSATKKDEKAVIADLVDLLKKRRIENEKDAIDYLVANGIDKDKAGEITSDIIQEGGQMMSKSFSSAVSAILKSLTGGESEKKCNKAELPEAELEEEKKLVIEEPDEKDGGGEKDEGEEKDKKPESAEKDDDEMVEGGEILKALDADLTLMQKSIVDTNKRIDDLGEALTSIAQALTAIGNEKLPPKSVMSKSLDGAQAAAQPGASQRPTEDDLYRAQCVLAKAVKEGRLDMVKSSMISSDLQKCMYTGKPMRKDYYEFLQKELAKEAN